MKGKYGKMHRYNIEVKMVNSTNSNTQCNDIYHINIISTVQKLYRRSLCGFKLYYCDICFVRKILFSHLHVVQHRRHKTHLNVNTAKKIEETNQ